MSTMTTNRFGLRCSDPNHHRHFGRVFATCAERAPLEESLAVVPGSCFELVEAGVNGWEVPGADR